MSTQLPPVIERCLQQAEQRRRWRMALAGLVRSWWIAVGCLLVVMALDVLLRVSEVQRSWLSVLWWLTTCGVVGYAVIRPLLRRRSMVQIAHDVERLHPQGKDDLLASAVALRDTTATGVSQWMVERTVAQAAQLATSIDARQLIRVARVDVA